MSDYIRPPFVEMRFHAEDYERLRTGAVGLVPASLRDGLTILINRGVAAWMCCCSLPPAGPSRPTAPAALPPDAVTEVWLDMLRPHLTGFIAAGS